jgi:hypothetical protein
MLGGNFYQIHYSLTKVTTGQLIHFYFSSFTMYKGACHLFKVHMYICSPLQEEMNLQQKLIMAAKLDKCVDHISNKIVVRGVIVLLF